MASPDPLPAGAHGPVRLTQGGLQPGLADRWKARDRLADHPDDLSGGRPRIRRLPRAHREEPDGALEIFVRFDRSRLQLLRKAAMNDLVLGNAAAEHGPSRTVVTRTVTGLSVLVVNVPRVSSA